jgi:hypothetical protein
MVQDGPHHIAEIILPGDVFCHPRFWLCFQPERIRLERIRGMADLAIREAADKQQLDP